MINKLGTLNSWDKPRKMANRAVSAMSLRSQIKEDYLTCAICFNPFDKPKALPCIHTFCLDCLRDFITSRGYEATGIFPCPVCRIDTNLPHEGVTGFPDNYYIASLKDTVEKPARPAPPIPKMDNPNYQPLAPAGNLTHFQPMGEMSNQNYQQNYQIDSTSPLYPTVPQTGHESGPEPQALEQSDLPCSGGMMLKFGKHAPTVSDFQKPYGLAIGKNGEYIITDRGGSRILVFSKSGVLLSRFVCDGKVASCAMTADSNIMVAVDTSPGKAIMQLYNFDGKLLKIYGDFYQHDKPSGIAISSRNHVAITNLEAHNVLLFTEQRKFSTKFGWKGSGDNHFLFPQFVAINNKDHIIVSDSGNDCVKVFDQSGNFKRKFGESGEAKGHLMCPMGVATDANNNIIVADAGNFRVEIFTSKGQHIRTLVKDTDLISVDVKPLNVAVTPNNNIVVLLSGPQFAEVRVYRWGGNTI